MFSNKYTSDKAAIGFLLLALSYLLAGLLFGVLGGMQYVLPAFLKELLAFQKTRPLHVYLVTSWIFTAAQGCMYYFIPRYAQRELAWVKGAWLQLVMQALLSVVVVGCFFAGQFGGREYLEFPPVLGVCILASWIPFAVNFFATLKPNYAKAPVYIWSWTIGILFFFITLSESYLWVFDFFGGNAVRDVTVQWKALGSMVGSWNMLIYGCTMYSLQQLSGGDDRSMKKSGPFFFFFVGLTNLMFNWGHHTYIVPAAPWVKTVAYAISMTELLLLGQIIYKWRRTLSAAQKNYHLLPCRLFSFADAWIFLNLAIAIALSVPALNFYTHGTHITVAHAMGATIGINTMLLFGTVLFIAQHQQPEVFQKKKLCIAFGASLTNIALMAFWFSLVGSGLVKIAGKLHNESFAQIMQKSQPLFKLFSASGLFIFVGLGLMLTSVMQVLLRKHTAIRVVEQDEKLARELTH